MTQVTTDRNEIERWAEQHDAVPVREDNHVDIVSEKEMSPNTNRIDWETFHQNVDDENRVVMFHEGSNGHSRFEVSERTDALERVDLDEDFDREQIEQRLLEGETVTGTVTETTVVRETIVEEATLESDIVDRNIIDRRVTDLELLERNCHSCAVDTAAESLTYQEWGETDRFLDEDADITTGEKTSYDQYPYGVSVDVDERWLVTIEEHEEYTVETRITDVDVTETDQVDSQDFRSTVDLDAVHDQLLGSLDIDRRSSGAVADSDRTDTSGGVVDTEGSDSAGTIVDTESYDIESEFTEDDTISTSLTSLRTIEKELSEQWRLGAEVVAGELLARETHQESVLESSLAGRGRDGNTTAVEGTDTHRRNIPSEDDEGKPVFAGGDKIGMISEVEGSVAYMDPHPGLTERIMAKLGWTEKDEADYKIGTDRITEITDDEVRLADTYDET